MKINPEQFEAFWTAKGQYLKIDNPTKIKDNLIIAIKELASTEALDEYVRCLKTRRETERCIVVEFYHYLQQNGVSIDSDLFDKHFCDSVVERQLEMAKFLHEKKTKEQLRNRFDLDDRTLNKDLRALADGITVLGSTIRIEREKKDGCYYYSSTLHPVFLPLNLTEVYALTVYLNRMLPDDDDPNASLLRSISERIKTQLSDYAYDRLFPGQPRRNTENTYINDEDLAKTHDGIYMYLMKTSQPCTFYLRGQKEQKYKGSIVYDGEKYRISSENEAVNGLSLSEVDFVIEDLDYR